MTTITTIDRPKRRLRLPRYSMATLYGFVTIICLFLGLVVRPAEQQRRAVEAFGSLNNIHVYYDYHYTINLDSENNIRGAFHPNAPLPGPDWLREMIGIDYFADVVCVNCVDLQMYGFTIETSVYEKAFRHLQHFRELEILNIGCTGVTDRSVNHFASLPRLRSVDLTLTDVTDAGLARLSDATQIQELGLSWSQVTNDGLDHLAKLSKLQTLGLASCKISDDGLARLSKLPELRILSLDGTLITDDGLRHLTGLRRLTHVYARGTEITQEGVDTLQKALPNCKVIWD